MVIVKSSIFIWLTWTLRKMCISGHWIQPKIIFEVNIGQKVNICQISNFSGISKILNFYPIELKFEEDFYVWSLNSTTNCFSVLWILQVNNLGWHQSIFALHDVFLVCLSLCEQDVSKSGRIQIKFGELNLVDEIIRFWWRSGFGIKKTDISNDIKNDI